MKLKLLILPFLLFAFSLSFAQKGKNNKGAKSGVVLKTRLDSVSYALGMNIGQNLKNENIDSLNTEVLGKALHAYLHGDSTQIKAMEASYLVNNYFKELKDKLSTVLHLIKN